MPFEEIVDDFRFNGKIVPALTASVVNGPWAKADTSSAGTPTLAAAGGFMVGAFDAQSEVQNLCLYHGDILSYDIDDLVSAEFWIKTVAALDAASQLAFGMESARNDAIDSIAEAALFRIIGNNSVVVESDDGTNNNDDVATGQTLVAAVKRFHIDFKTGIQSKVGVQSVGGKANVLFSMSDGRGALRPVARATQFDMSNYAGGLQPFVQLQKTADTNVDSFSLQRVRIVYRVEV